MRFSWKSQFSAMGKKQQLSLVFRLIAMIVTFAMLITTIFAWTSLNKDTNSDNMDMSIEYDLFFVEPTYYKYNVKDERVETSSDLTSINFNPYDLVFRSRNRYTPIVVAIKMTGEDLNKSGGTITIQINRNESLSGYDTDGEGKMHLSHIFTSIMRVTAYVGSSYYSDTPQTLFENVDSTDHYSAARAQVTETGNSKLFTSATMENQNDGYRLTGITKKNVTISVDYTSSDFNTIDGEQTLFVYLYFTYDEGYTTINDALDYYGLLGKYQKTSESLSLGSGDITDTSIKFENDLVSIRVSHS